MDFNLSIPLEVSAMMDHEKEDTVSFALRIFSMVLMAITFVLGIIGNGLVIWVLVFRMHRTVTTICYQNLALADFSLSATMPFVIASMATRGHWPCNVYLCKIMYIVIYFNLFSSIFITLFISLDRYICVLHPVWAQNHRTIKLATKLLLGPWTLAFILTVPIIVTISNTANKDLHQHCICFLSFALFEAKTHEELELLFEKLIVRGTIWLILGFILPMVIVPICYCLIAAKISRTNAIQSNRSLRLLITIVASIFICWFPFQLVELLRMIWIKLHLNPGSCETLKLLVLLTGALAFFNSCLNPIIYVFMGRDFRQSLIHSLPASLEKALTEDPGPNPQSKTKSELQAM